MPETDDHGLPITVQPSQPDADAVVKTAAVVFDIDGVLCDSSESIADACADAGGGEFVDWVAWDKEANNTLLPREGWPNLARVLWAADVAVILLTCRQEPSREGTELWLKRHQIPFDELLMRPVTEDYHTWKTTAIEALRTSPYDVHLAIDDSHHHCRAMAELVPVLHVETTIGASD